MEAGATWKLGRLLSDDTKSSSTWILRRRLHGYWGRGYMDTEAGANRIQWLVLHGY